MLTARDVMRCLPLLASVLGRQYGVDIVQQGNTASTNGKTVYLPLLPITNPEETLALIRGYIDHEAGGHIRYTDFDELRKSNMDQLENNLWNAIEDWRVESKVSEYYPGCRANLAWLARKFFVNDWKPSDVPEACIFEYVLRNCRSWNVPEIEANSAVAEESLRKLDAKLFDEIRQVMRRIKASCPDTKAAIAYAKEICALARKRKKLPTAREIVIHLQIVAGQGAAGQQGQIAKKPGNRAKRDGKAGDSQEKDGKPESGNGKSDASADKAVEIDIDALLDALPKDTGSMTAEKIGEIACKTPERQRTGSAVPVNHTLSPLSEEEYQAAMRISSGLRSRLAGTLQAQTLRKVAPGRRGRLNGNALHKVFVHDQKVFRKDSEARNTDTAVHLLIDCSGSMYTDRMKTARQSAYALAVALSGVKGVNVGVTAFPGSSYFDNTVLPVLKHGESLHRRFSIDGHGGTPLTEALLRTLQVLHQQPEPRKIMFVITDGCPNDYNSCRQAIAEVCRLGMEIYGIGIGDDTIEQLLPRRSAVVQKLEDLAPNLFNLMQRALTLGTRP